MKDNILVIASEIPIWQNTIIIKPNPSENSQIEIVNSPKFPDYENDYALLHYSNIGKLAFKKVIILQYYLDETYLESYRSYLLQVYSALNKLVEIDSANIDGHNEDDQELLGFVKNYSRYVPTNAELPLMHLDKDKFEHYLQTFEAEFLQYSYIFIKYNSDPLELANQIESSINGIVSDINNFSYVVNIGKEKIKEALHKVVTKHNLIPYNVDYCKDSKYYRYIASTTFPNSPDNKILGKLQYEAVYSTQELINISEQYKIPEPMNHIDKRNYYFASICIMTSTTFLAQGPSGSGKSFSVKEVVSNLKRDDNYIELNCACLSGELLISHLFGHIKGAFTGAVSDKTGYVEEYSKGIIFMDEIGELSLIDQAKILRYIETGYYTKLGETREKISNALLLFATNRDLKEMCDNKLFRWDLYFRISKNELLFKPFEDLDYDAKIDIIKFIVNKCNENLKESQINKSDYNDKFLSEEATNVIIFKYTWQGNIREIYNIINKAFTFTLTTEITKLDLYKSIQHKPHEATTNPFDIKFSDIEGKGAMKLVSEFKKKITEVALKEKITQKKAADSIGLSPQTFNNWYKSEQKKK
ncbi:MAG: sigma 54-interacting transcriptional regulator [Candidatus Tenebribacter davisii]|nr:sigma 54-interacting transcriptional regulator [Candidatus Tenebribacter davisii]